MKSQTDNLKGTAIDGEMKRNGINNVELKLLYTVVFKWSFNTKNLIFILGVYAYVLVTTTTAATRENQQHS